jgi:hypothetical protein
MHEASAASRVGLYTSTSNNRLPTVRLDRGHNVPVLKKAFMTKSRKYSFGLIGMLAVYCSLPSLDASAGPAQVMPQLPQATASLPSTNYGGLWWNDPAGSESGWGIDFAHQGDIIFATWFTYDQTGSALWLVMTAYKLSEGVYSGGIVTTTGPSYASVPFDPRRVARTMVGTGTLTFNDLNNGTFEYTVSGVTQRKQITHEIFGPLPICIFGSQTDLALATNYQDMWWNPSESGWGISLTHQGSTIFAAWFTYDQDGTPIWLSFTATPTQQIGAYSGTIFRASGPAFFTVPFDPMNVTRSVVGTATLTFASGNSATFAYTLFGVAQVKSITREVFQEPGTDCQ